MRWEGGDIGLEMEKTVRWGYGVGDGDEDACIANHYIGREIGATAE